MTGTETSLPARSTQTTRCPAPAPLAPRGVNRSAWDGTLSTLRDWDLTIAAGAVVYRERAFAVSAA